MRKVLAKCRARTLAACSDEPTDHSRTRTEPSIEVSLVRRGSREGAVVALAGIGLTDEGTRHRVVEIDALHGAGEIQPESMNAYRCSERGGLRRLRSLDARAVGDSSRVLEIAIEQRLRFVHVDLGR